VAKAYAGEVALDDHDVKSCHALGRLDLAQGYYAKPDWTVYAAEIRA
jgi:hypothetical protein